MQQIIVTGGFGALGRAIVADLIGRGVKVAAVDLAPAPADTVATAAIGGVDLTDEAAVVAAYASAAGELGGVDGLVNVAGGFTFETVADGSIDSWDAMYRINLRTASLSCRAVLAHMIAGAIVNVGAAAATAPGAGMAPYAASKAGVMALTESLADELKPRRIRVNAVLPTILDTLANRQDMPHVDPAGWVSPASAAKVVRFLLSDDAGPITGVGVRLSLGG